VPNRVWVEKEQTPSSGPRNLEPRWLRSASSPPPVPPAIARVAQNAKRPDPRKDCLGPESQFAAKRKEAAAAARGSRSTALVKSKATIAGELYDQSGKPIAAVIDATPDTRTTRPRLAGAQSTKPSSLATAVKDIPSWGWVAIVAAVGAGAYAVMGESGSSLSWGDDGEWDDADDDDGDDDDEEIEVA
jgi:hypothetical protein